MLVKVYLIKLKEILLLYFENQNNLLLCILLFLTDNILSKVSNIFINRLVNKKCNTINNFNLKKKNFFLISSLGNIGLLNFIFCFDS